MFTDFYGVPVDYLANGYGIPALDLTNESVERNEDTGYVKMRDTNLHHKETHLNKKTARRNLKNLLLHGGSDGQEGHLYAFLIL